ncbi:tenascin, partial [Apostichopus japonicus]
MTEPPPIIPHSSSGFRLDPIPVCHVFQRRVDGSVDFYRNWADYKQGFGQADQEFWIGNEKLYYLTNKELCELRIDFVNTLGDPYFAKFDSFRTSNENDQFRLEKLGDYSGNS